MALFSLLALLLAGILFGMMPSIPQPPSYHRFADPHVCFGQPFCADLVSNLPFVFVGLAGLVFLSGRRTPSLPPSQRWAYWRFFFTLVLAGLASAYYHLAPDNQRLAVDRTAIVLVLSAWLSIVVGERFKSRFIPAVFIATTGLGLATVITWIAGESAGRGDLRPYLFFQTLTFLVALAAVLSGRFAMRPYHFATVVLYALALACDLADRPLAEALGFVSGHTLKHLFAAVASWMPLRGLMRLESRR